MKKLYSFVITFLFLFCNLLAQPVFEPFIVQSKPFNLAGIESIKMQINDENNCLTALTKSELKTQLQSICSKYGLKVSNNDARAAVQIYVRYYDGGGLFEMPTYILRLDVLEKVKTFRNDLPVEAITFSINMIAKFKTKEAQNSIVAQYADYHFPHFIGEWLGTNPHQ